MVVDSRDETQLDVETEVKKDHGVLYIGHRPGDLAHVGRLLQRRARDGGLVRRLPQGRRHPQAAEEGRAVR